MDGRVYDPLLARFGTPDPTENPFSTQGWNRYSYVGNSPLNFTDPSGYCFLGCFWKPIFKAIGKFFRESWRAMHKSQLGSCAPRSGPFVPALLLQWSQGFSVAILGLRSERGSSPG
jgi:hypothetical protein